MKFSLSIEEGSVTVTGKNIKMELDSDSTAEIIQSRAEFNDSITRKQFGETVKTGLGMVGKYVADKAAKAEQNESQRKPAAKTNQRNRKAVKRTGTKSRAKNRKAGNKA